MNYPSDYTIDYIGSFRPWSMNLKFVSKSLKLIYLLPVLEFLFFDQFQIFIFRILFFKIKCHLMFKLFV